MGFVVGEVVLRQFHLQVDVSLLSPYHHEARWRPEFQYYPTCP